MNIQKFSWTALQRIAHDDAVGRLECGVLVLRRVLYEAIMIAKANRPAEPICGNPIPKAVVRTTETWLSTNLTCRS